MMTLTIKCPQCAKPVPWTPQARFKPFCSERCKLIDLGSWAAGEHAIPGAPVDPDMLPDGEDGKLNG